ncbi:hypothetical protein VTI74DRAFT_5350 [Chaetomium olivicolor]
MRLPSRAVWSVVASLACLVATVEAAGMLEVDLLFPRANETYAPTPYMPINQSNPHEGQGDIYEMVLTWANWTNDKPHFVYTSKDNFPTEASWMIIWEVYCTSCKKAYNGLLHGNLMTNYSSPSWIEMTTKRFDRCVVVPPSTPTPAPAPCRLKRDSATAANIFASLKAELCHGLNPPADCPSKPSTNTAQRLAVAGAGAGAGWLAAAFGALRFLLA